MLNFKWTMQSVEHRGQLHVDITPVAPKFTCLLDYILVTSQPSTKLILSFTTMASSGGNGC